MREQKLLPEYRRKAEQVRKDFGEGDAVRDAGRKRPDDVEWRNDISYGAHGKWNLLDLYYPKGAKGALPTIVSVHGGGWVYGTKEVYQFYCCSLAERGFAVVNCNYRLAPEHPFPAALEDINAVFCWIGEHGAGYGIDTNNLFAVGDSAGAQLLSQYMAMLTNDSFGKKYEELYGFHFPDVRVRAIALNCGRYEMTAPQDQEMDLLFRAYFNGEPAEFEELTETKRYLTPQYPPAFVMTAWHDFLREEAQPMTEALKRAGAEAECHLYGSPQAAHIGHVFHCDMRLEEAKRCNDEECAFFKRHIRKNGNEKG